jgi:peptidyl-prolyl cis-trans isomerase SurA
VKSKFIFVPLFLTAIFVVAPFVVQAQEGDPVVLDEVIAQINDGVITLSQLKREMKEQTDVLKQRGMTAEQAAAEVEKHKIDLIITLINEQLLVQKGKELELTEKVEQEVNRRFLEIAKQQGIPTMEALIKAMNDSGISYDETRQTMRAEIMKQAVLETEVDSKIFYTFKPEEMHAYFDQHKDRFLNPETVELSEIFLSLAGKPETDVKTRATQLVAQLRGGANFATLAKTSSERGAENGGKVGLFEVPNLRPDIAAAIKDLKVGGISEPLRSDEGYDILRVDARTAGSNTPVFNENKVREAMTAERSPKARETYLQTLRDDAYIKIAKDYSDQILPALKLKQDTIVEKTGDDSEKKPEKKKGKFLGIIPKP